MSTPVDSDIYLVNRGGSSFTVTQENIMAELQDTDLLLVNRGAVSYKITGADFKDSIVTPINPDPGNISSVPAFQGGTGTQADPFVLASSICMPAGSNVNSTELITITVAGAQEGQPVTWINNSVGSGARFDQPGGSIGANGLWTGHLVYDDTPATTVDQTYAGSLQIGTCYFTWDVNQIVNNTIPPVINSVILGESSPGEAPRFTDQSFVLSTSIDNGTPNSVKTIDAFVDGTIITRAESDAIDNVATSPAGTPWVTATAAQVNPWYSVAYGDDRFVAVSVNGTYRVMYSDDSAVTWSSASAPEANSWCSVTYGNGKFVAVSFNGTNQVMYSDDGINWSSASAPEANGWQSVTYGDGKFVAVAYSGTNRVMYSTDGINWSAAAAAEANGWYSVTYGNGKFVAISADGTNQVMYSSDAITWSAASAAESGNWLAVTYGDGKFVGVGSTGTRAMYSTDGISWTSATAPLADWIAVTYGDGKFVAVSYDGAERIMWSLNGINWTGVVAPAASGWQGITYGGGQFVSVAYSGTDRVMWSTSGTGVITEAVIEFVTDTGLAGFNVGDPVESDPAGASGYVTATDTGLPPTMTVAPSTGTWNVGDTVVGPETVIENTRRYLEFNNAGVVSSLLVAPQSPAYTTQDTDPGLTFTFPATFPSGQTPDQELGVGTTITASVVADNGTSVGPVNSNIVQPIAPPLPETSAIISVVSGTVGGWILSDEWLFALYQILGLTYGEGRFVAVGSNGANTSMFSEDGIVWTATTSAQLNSWQSVAYGNGVYVAVASDGDDRVMTGPWFPGGTTIDWASVSVEQNQWYSVAFGDGKFVAVSINGTDRTMTSTDGITWAPSNSAPTSEWGAVAYGDGMWVAVAGGGTERVMYSTDGINWTGVTVFQSNWVDVAYGNGIWVALSAEDEVITSTDGITWSNTATPLPGGTGNNWASIIFANGQFIATNQTNNDGIAWSVDGITWTLATTPGFKGWVTCTYGDGKFVAGSTNGAIPMMYSTTGRNSQASKALFFDSALNLDEFNVGDAVVSNPAAATGTVVDVDPTNLWNMTVVDSTGTWANGQTVVGPPAVTSMTQSQYTQQALMFATYDNRRMVNCGNDAQARRDDLIAELQSEGYTLAEIEAMIGQCE